MESGDSRKGWNSDYELWQLFGKSQGGRMWEEFGNQASKDAVLDFREGRWVRKRREKGVHLIPMKLVI
jgi:hypothetical protein